MGVERLENICLNWNAYGQNLGFISANILSAYKTNEIIYGSHTKQTKTSYGLMASLLKKK